MARTKQAAPVRREPSSEYVGKEDRVAALRSRSQEAGKQAPEAASTGAGSEPKAVETSAAAAGIQQVVIAVAGIYGSL